MTSPDSAPRPVLRGLVPPSVSQRVKALVARTIHWYVEPMAAGAAGRAADSLRAEVRPALDHLTRSADAVSVNFELLKGEFRALQYLIEELGTAIAPAAGLEGVAVRMAELRERVNSLERRTRRGPPGPGEAPAAPLADATAPPPQLGSQAAGSDKFDYLGFERRFRGDPEQLRVTMKSRYVELLRRHGPVLDVGCGSGELLSVLGEAGIDGRGVDLDADLVAEAAERGLQVEHADALTYLGRQPEGSLGAVVSLHVIEHLELGPLLELVELSASRLRSGGLFVAETPNPASLIVLGNSYVLDPTHVRPLHPSLMVFLCEGAGFRDVRLEFHAPAEAYHLDLVHDPDAPPWVEQVNRSLERLNTVLFGPQEYTVIATTP